MIFFGSIVEDCCVELILFLLSLFLWLFLHKVYLLLLATVGLVKPLVSEYRGLVILSTALEMNFLFRLG